MLHHPKHCAPLTLSVDASDIAVGGVLQQIVDGQLQPPTFFSRKLRKPETKYSAFDRELLAMHLSVRHFRYFLEGRPFVIFTDHKPLTFAFSKVSDAWSTRQQRQLAVTVTISEFTTDVRHIAGKANLVASTSSRASLSMVVFSPPDLDFVAVAQAQQIPEIQTYHTAIAGLQLEDVPVGPDKVCLLCDVSLKLPRPVVPPSWRWKVFVIIHGLSHPSIRTTRQLMRQKYVWHRLHKDVGLFTRWPEAIPMPDATVKTCARAFLFNWVARFGVPANISTDRGPQFTARLWDTLVHLLGVRLHRTCAYHPQANGLVERFHRHLKSALMERLKDTN